MTALPLPLHTNRLTLRPARAGDGPAMLAYYGDPDVTRYIPPQTLDAEGVEKRLATYLANTDPQEPGQALNLMLDLDGRLVGDLMLRLTAAAPGRPPEVAEVGWILNPTYAGRGLATEAARALIDLAFEHYGLHRVSAQLDPRNVSSSRLCERLGMTHEGITRRDYWCKGEWADTSTYGLLREEWHALGTIGA